MLLALMSVFAKAGDANAGTVLVFIALIVIVAAIIIDRPSPASTWWWLIVLAIVLMAIALLVGVTPVVD